MNKTKTGVLMAANNGVEFEKVMVVGGTILLIIVVGYKVLRNMIRVLIEKVENGIDYFNRTEIDAEKARTEALLQKYELEKTEIDNEQQEKICTKII